MTSRVAGARRVLRVLIAEDSADDYELLLMELTRGGYELVHERVDTRDAMQHALREKAWDLVVTDWSMPQFTALEALDVLREQGLDRAVPCIVASGTVSEEVAVEALRNGARDFFAKDRLARLLPAVDRELREAQAREERDRMKEQLLISDRMASVGMLAAGVAHEINNPLVAVLANLELAIADLPALTGTNPKARDTIEALDDAHRAALRIRAIVRDLKLFSRADDESQVAVDVHDVLESSLRMAENEIRHRARLVRDLAAVPRVQANASRLGQVFLNLIVNAVQAIPEGSAHTNEIRVATKHLVAEDRVLVEVTDTGAGMTPEVRQRLFTPFFTTKAIGVGTGLGLSICHRIVTALGGEIVVDSAPGRGSSFRVFLPVTQAPAPEAVPSLELVVPVVRRGRILIVDDEPVVAAALGRGLERDHDVTIVDRGVDAVELIETGWRFDAIISDVMMPQMTGADLFAELRRIAPDQAELMIFVTGGAFTQTARDFLDTVPNPHFEKPFDMKRLRRLIAERIG